MTFMTTHNWRSPNLMGWEADRSGCQFATKYPKKWAGPTKSANTALLYLPQKMGGLNLPFLTCLFKRLQVSCQSQLLTSPDPCVQHLSEKNLQHEAGLPRKKFWASMFVRDVLALDPSWTRKSLTTVAKRITQEVDGSKRPSELKSLEKRGYDERSHSWWSLHLLQGVQTLPAKQMKFALNAAIDILPTSTSRRRN